ncbi:hypothetical protein AB0395_47550 [Streptosporangium sp. NPDC051023]|uniref:hypothetical protein n=1 Tax=Streptosporangium sp. NPDC051023 TaxID=3155410 RepID=UPI00344E6AB6
MARNNSQADQLTQTLVVEGPERLVYSQAIVAMFQGAAEPELNKAAVAIAEREATISKLKGEIAAWEKHAAGIRQAIREVEANSVPAPPITPARCGSCQELIVLGEFGWVHAGRELKADGHLCNPERMDSPSAKPAAPGELSANPDALVASIEATHEEFKGVRR